MDKYRVEICLSVLHFLLSEASDYNSDWNPLQI